MIKCLLYTLLMGLGVALVATFFMRWLDIPQVHVSHLTNKCVRIVQANGEILPCSKLKELDRYERVWVE